MTHGIFTLLLLSSLLHAIWNAVSKNVPHRDAFFTLILGGALLLYAPVALYYIWQEPIPSKAYPWMMISMFCELLYFLFLAKAYKATNLSLAYPIVRGTAPLTATILGFFLFTTPISFTGFLGVFLIVIGVFSLNYPSLTRNPKQCYPALIWAILAGFFNGVAAVSDGMGAQIMPAIYFKYLVFVGMFIGKWVIDRCATKPTSYRSLLQRHPWETILGSLFVFGANALAVYAMQSTPVGYVAAVREMSIVFATLIGLFWFREKINQIQWIAISTILLGVLTVKIS